MLPTQAALATGITSVGRGRAELWLCRILSKTMVRFHAEFILLVICQVQGEAKSCPGRAERGHMQVALTPM